MTEPTRLRDLKQDDLRARLIRSAAVDAPREGAHARAATAIGLAPSIGAGSAVAAHSASKTLIVTIVKWLGLGTLAGAVTAGVASKSLDAWTGSQTAATRAVGTTNQPLAVANTPTDSEQRPAAFEPTRPPLTSAPLPAARVAAAPPTVSPAAAVAETKPADSLADELRMVDRAREALASGNAAGALAALDRYQSAYPHARLGDESSALRIEALIKKGNRAEASALANRFLNEHPKSPLSQRVRTLIGQ